MGAKLSERVNDTSLTTDWKLPKAWYLALVCADSSPGAQHKLQVIHGALGRLLLLMAGRQAVLVLAAVSCDSRL